MPLFGPPNVEKLEQKKDVRGLLKALSYSKDGAVRASAAQALGGVGGPDLVPALAALLEDPDPAVRESSVRALSRLASRHADPDVKLAITRELLGAIDSYDEAVRAPAFEALPEIAARIKGTVWAVDAAQRMLAEVEDPDSPVRREAISGLLQLGSVLRGTPDQADAVRALEPLVGPHSGWSLQNVARSLAALGAPPVEALIGLLDQKRHYDRLEAAKALRDLAKGPHLDDAQKQRILAQRSRMSERHWDRSGHTDRSVGPSHQDQGAGHRDHTPASDCTDHTDVYSRQHQDVKRRGSHTDQRGSHVDQGIGVELWV